MVAHGHRMIVTMASASAHPAPAATLIASTAPLYCKWLANTLDTQACIGVLHMLSTFDSLDHRGYDECRRYAESWCQLAEFLWDNRHRQLYSSRVEMVFPVGDDQETNCYWFEVVRACDLLLTTLLAELAQELHTVDLLRHSNSGDARYAEIVSRQLSLPWASAFARIRETIGVCHYVTYVAAERCPLLRKHAGLSMDRIRVGYEDLRVIGVWIKGRMLMTVPDEIDYKRAATFFSSAEWMHAHCLPAETLRSPEAQATIACFTQSIEYMRCECVLRQMAQAGKVGFAVAYARDHPPAAESDRRQIQGVLGSLKDSTERAGRKVALVPPKNSDLLLGWDQSTAVEQGLLRTGLDPLQAPLVASSRFRCLNG